MKIAGRYRRYAWSVAACATAAVALSACGDNGDTSGNGPSASQLAEARKTLDRISKPPTSVNLDAPLTKRLPAGTVVAHVAPDAPAYHLNDQGLREAAEVLGFEVKTFYTGSTADQFAQAFNSAAAIKPDIVWADSMDASTFQKWGAVWDKQKIPVINQGQASPPTSSNRFDYSPVALNNRLESVMADWAIADADGEPANTLIVTTPELPIFKGVGSALTSRFRRLCPGCKTHILNVALSDVGKTIPSQVAGYLQKNPDTKYVIFTLGDTATGVPQTLKTSGVSGVKLGVVSAGPAVACQVKSGEIAVDLAYAQAGQGFILLDFATRYLTGQSTEPDKKWFNITQLLNKQTMGDCEKPYQAFPDFAGKWREVWFVR